MIAIPVKGTIVSSSNKWIYDWIGIQATCPEDVEKLLIKAKSNNEDVVVEINSGGGEVFAGFEIYTLIRQYEGNKEIHIVGLAGSAASVIAMSAVCKISPVGMIMIHNSSTYTEGDYREMDISSGMLQAINSSIRLAYLQKSKVDEKALIELMDNETWMNARDAIANGFADSMLFEEEEVFTPVASVKDIVLSASTLNKIKKLKAENKLNDASPEIILKENETVTVSNTASESAKAVHIEHDKKGGEKNMTYAEIKSKYPDAAIEIEKLISDAEERGVKNERKRLQDIDDISGNIDSKLVQDAKYGENPVTAEQLALKAIRNNSMLGDAYMKAALSDVQESGTNNVDAEPHVGDDASEDEKLADIAANAANQKRKVK